MLANHKVDPYSRSRSNTPIDDKAVIITGNSNKELSDNIALHLGKSVLKSNIRKFADGESGV
jgi:phosphoribosylpyrophosphate synthetase